MAGRSCFSWPNGSKAHRSPSGRKCSASRSVLRFWCCSWASRCSTTSCASSIDANPLKKRLLTQRRSCMQPRAVLATFALIFQGAAALAQSPADAEFTVSDIRVEGLQRISEGTVFNYLPVNIGDTLNARRVREAIRALYAPGFFSDVQLRREGNTLVVVVLERPSIESFDITGNKDIKTEDLQDMLRKSGLTVGKTFDRSVLDEVTQYLTDMYFSRG